MGMMTSELITPDRGIIEVEAAHGNLFCILPFVYTHSFINCKHSREWQKGEVSQPSRLYLRLDLWTTAPY